jgi:hypothetical protein
MGRRDSGRWLGLGGRARRRRVGRRGTRGVRAGPGRRRGSNVRIAGGRARSCAPARAWSGPTAAGGHRPCKQDRAEGRARCTAHAPRFVHRSIIGPGVARARACGPCTRADRGCTTEPNDPVAHELPDEKPLMSAQADRSKGGRAADSASGTRIADAPPKGRDRPAVEYIPEVAWPETKRVIRRVVGASKREGGPGRLAIVAGGFVLRVPRLVRLPRLVLRSLARWPYVNSYSGT